MALTLNQIVSRLRSLALSHRQINHFYFGDKWEFDANEDITYAGCFVESQPGNYDKVTKIQRLNFRISFYDRVGVSEDTEGNETEVLSDMRSVALDFISMLSNPVYQYDWTIADTGSIIEETEQLGDMVAGVSVDLGIDVPFLVDSCQVPADDTEFEQTFDMPRTKIYTYTADGTEVDSFAVSFLSGKPILAIWRSGYYKRAVSVAPTDAEKIQVGVTDLGNGLGILGNGTVILESGDGLITNEKVDFLYYA